MAIGVSARTRPPAEDAEQRLRAMTDRVGPALANLRQRDTLRASAAVSTRTGGSESTHVMARKYSKVSSKKVERALHERKHGKLKRGASGKSVRTRKQAIAIGLSEARRAGKKVPKKRGSS